jgi:hypothetical protein
MDSLGWRERSGTPGKGNNGTRALKELKKPKPELDASTLELQKRSAGNRHAEGANSYAAVAASSVPDSKVGNSLSQ